jgi:hypothetical protein
MKRLIAAALVLGAVLLVPGEALARGDGWQPSPTSPDSEVACPGGAVLVHTVVNREYFRITTLADGTALITVTGALKDRLTNEATGQSIIVNASGPSVGQFPIKAFPNGDFQFQAAGRNLGMLTPEQATSTGLPPLLLTAGPISVLITSTGGRGGRVG